MQYDAEDAIRSELEQILKSDQFNRAQRLSTFLSYVVTQTLDGHGAHLKAVTIAVEAFNRDPMQDDPYVRNIATSVRRALSSYYEQNATEVRIDIPTGSYNPQFTTRQSTTTPIVRPTAPIASIKPTVAIIPFKEVGNGDAHSHIGEVFVDDLINRFSKLGCINVISRLSTMNFSGNSFDLNMVKDKLNADYVISGSFTLSQTRVKINIELADTQSGHVVYTEQINTTLKNLLQIERGFFSQIANHLTDSITKNEVDRSFTHEPMALENYTLMIAAIHLLYRITPSEFKKSKELLDELIKRGVRSPLPHAWSAKWHVLNHVQGNNNDMRWLQTHAIGCTERALEIDSTCALALTLDGLVHTNIMKQLDIGEERYNQALDSNPSDALARVLRGTLFAFKGDGARAMDDVTQAMKLSPLDPMKYYYLSLSSTAALAAEDYEAALGYANDSLKLNRHHASTLRAATIAHINLDQPEAAQQKVERLLQVDPEFTIKRFMAESPSTAFKTGQHWAESLRRAGVP